MKIRINKYLADKGLTSRREADQLIQAGKVFINNKKAVLGQKVDAKDSVLIQRDTRVQIQKSRQYLLFNKPKGIVTVNAKEGEREVKDIVQLDRGVVPIGRLDKNSSGLILLTNDGRVTKKLLSPDSHCEKEYLISVNKNIRPAILEKFEQGISLEDGYVTKPAKVKKLSDRSISITIHEGKRHQIRRMFAVLGYELRSLKRVRIANLKINGLSEGELVQLSANQKKEFLSFLGIS